MSSQSPADEVNSEHPHSLDEKSPLIDEMSTSKKATPSASMEKETQTKSPLPSHATLAYSNYPPLWSPGAKPSSRPKAQQIKAQSYTSAESMKAILNTGSSSSKNSSHRFDERDPGNQHQYLQGPDRRYTHPRLNIFGRDIRAPRSPSIFGIGKKK